MYLLFKVLNSNLDVHAEFIYKYNFLFIANLKIDFILIYGVMIVYV